MGLSEYINVIASAITSFLFVFTVIPSIIKIADIKHLYDSEGGRKSHTGAVPNLAGIAIFGGFLISFCLFCDFQAAPEVQYLLAALCFVFMLGVKDDMVELTPHKKFLGQILAAIIITYLGDVRLTSFYGILGISEIPYWLSIIFSTITIVFIINAFNLIDGINWLASGVTLVITSVFGIWFFVHGFNQYAIMSATVFGAIIAFMRYNYSPAKIFMGDSGSLSLGLISAMLAVVFIEKSSAIVHSSEAIPFHIKSAPSFAIAVLIIPIFDTLRVFSMRILKRKSPFQADRTHVHHQLIDLGLTHIQASLILVAVNFGFVLLAFLLQDLRNVILTPIILGVAIISSVILYSLKPKTEEVSTTAKNVVENAPLNIQEANAS